MNTIEVFPWNENFETGIFQIDEQHKCLVNLLNMLASHLAYQADKHLLDNIFNELTEYAHYHFKAEEGIWRQFFNDDDWINHHQDEHQNFVNELLELQTEETSKSFYEVAEDILSFLTHWLAFHILECDKRMAKTVLAIIQQDVNLTDAKQHAELQMGGVTKLLIETILKMYDSLSIRTLQLMREITKRQKVEEKLQLAVNVFDNTLDAICITDADFMVIDANPSFYKITGLSDDEVMQQDLCLLKTGLLTQQQVDNFWDALHNSGHWSGLIHSRKLDGGIETEWLTLSAVKNPEGILNHYVAIFSNVSHLIRQQQTLEKIAHHDMLTGLPNRLLLKDRLKLAMVQTERTKTFLAVCYLDLDGFKPVNDTFGHITGDYLLQEVAKRFSKCLRGCDTVARLGGDEFVILLGNLQHPTDYIPSLERILLEICQPFQLQNTTINVSASIGVTVYPKDNSDFDTLLHHADLAMYQVKQTGKSRYCEYQPTL